MLQGVIAIDSAIFPKGTTGYLLDPLARKALWADGLDFRYVELYEHVLIAATGRDMGSVTS